MKIYLGRDMGKGKTFTLLHDFGSDASKCMKVEYTQAKRKKGTLAQCLQ